MNAQEINQRILDSKRAKIKIYPCNNLRASNIGNPCERFLYLLISHWGEQTPHDVGLQGIFDLGNHLEALAIQSLKEAGYEVITPTQRSWKVDNPLITGREDIRIKDPQTGELLPAEIKWLSPNEWDKLNAQEDFLRSSKPYIRGYPAQLLVYLYYFGKEHGFFILGNKLTGAVKTIDFRLDWDYADALIKKAERIYAALAAKDHTGLAISDDYSACDDCKLAHLCGASIVREETDIDDGELALLVDEKAKLATSAKRYDEIGQEIKRRVGDRRAVISGDYVLERRTYKRAPYAVQGSEYDRILVLPLTAKKSAG